MKLKEFRANGFLWDGHLEVMKWLRANGCPWNEETCMGATEGGQQKVLQWARANGCPWDGNTCSAAALGGHLEVLKWARANRCPWGTSLENAC